MLPVVPRTWDSKDSEVTFPAARVPRAAAVTTSLFCVTASSRAFAALLKNGTVVTWGDAKSGADSSQVSDRLRNVQQLHATHGAFVSLLADGSVVTWGDPALGGQLPQEYETMQVQELTASMDSFAAVLATGAVISWGKETMKVDIHDIP